VRDLRDELAQPPEGPLGLPRPPTPREVLSFTGEYAIPTAIAVLEANIRALEALEQVIRVLDPERSVVREEGGRLESRAADASRATLDRLESALEDVETTIRENDLPRDDEARDILDDARRINREIRDRIGRERTAADEARERTREIDRERDVDRDRTDETGDDLSGATTIELTDESDDADDETATGDGDEVQVDVEAELRSIKDEMEDRRRGPDADATGVGEGSVDGEADASGDGPDSGDAEAGDEGETPDES